MESDKFRHQRSSGDRQPLDRRLDKCIETGLQVVDGVAGNRPGQRRSNTSRAAGKNLEKVGRWVGEKLDWILEEEDAWLEPWQTDTSVPESAKKRPLAAISRRVPKMITSPDQNSRENRNAEEWPEESSFRVERWQRRSATEDGNSVRISNDRRELMGPGRRPLPRSSRKRD